MLLADRRYHCEACQPAQTTTPPPVGLAGASSLGLVIGQLADGRARYVAYRDSPTTELLQEALGGRAKAAWMSHLIPGHDDVMDYEHNKQCLAMTRGVMQIRNRPQRLGRAPYGLVSAEEESVGAAEERELAELQKLLFSSGPCSKRPAAPSTAAARAAIDLS